MLYVHVDEMLAALQDHERADEQEEESDRIDLDTIEFEQVAEHSGLYLV